MRQLLDKGAGKGAPSKDAVAEVVKKLTDEPGGPKIRCPKCRWQPKKSSRWWCSHCGTSWNTFDTHGKCPGCSFQWRDTACLQCTQWSLHEDWYEKSKPAE